MTITLGTGFFRAAAWSPDFTKAAFVMLDSHSQDLSPLYVIHISDTEPRPLATELEIAERSGLTWSPDSCWVAFSAKRRDCSSCDNTDIYRLNVETGEVRQLTTDPAEDIHPVWQPTP
jgi:Tol biopolymer transport system component